MAKSAKAKATVLLDKRPRQRLTECTAKAEEARFVSSFRRSVSKHVRRCRVRGRVEVSGRGVACGTWRLFVDPSLTHNVLITDGQAQQRAHLDLAPFRQ